MKHQPKLYSDIELTSEVASASPHRLIQMLLDHALQQIRLAKMALNNKQAKEKFIYLNRARDICEYLRICLMANDQKSKDLVKLLTIIYSRCERNLVVAALKNDTSYLDDTHMMLSNIKEGWDGIADKIGAIHV